MEKIRDYKKSEIVKVDSASHQQHNNCNSDYQPNWTRPHHNYSYQPTDYSKYVESGWQRFFRSLGMGFLAYVCFHLLRACVC